MRQLAPIFLIALIAFSCKSKTKTDAAEATAAMEKDQSEWTYLFDGTSTNGWRTYNGDSLPSGWIIKDGALTFDTEYRLEADRKGGKDIVYDLEEFANFELYLEWKLPEGGNSGIFYHLKDGYETPSEVSPEYQLLDDLKWEELNNAKLEEWQKTAADYAMYTPDESLKNVKPAGEWNTSRVRFTGEKVEHWFNGKKVLEFVPWSEDWYDRKSKGKWKDSPDYGKFKTGYIGLQDHDSPLWFRNIKIKKL